ncbi:MAG: hypothetical protein ACTSQ9_04135 [Candidatus Hodarchaeales archaeon]
MEIHSKKKDSLELATKILEEFFLDNENYSDNSSEFEKWRKWFTLKSSQFKSREISNTLYFSQIVRIRWSLISNTSINNEKLFDIEKVMRRKNYDLTQMEKTIPEPLSEQEITDLTRTLFNYLTTDEIRQIKSNPLVESLTKKIRDKRFGFSLDPDPNKNIRYIEDSNMYSDDINREKYLLGELYTEYCQ